jgi:hypothetical protein
MFNVRLKPISNQADWTTFIQMTSKQDGSLLDLTGGTTPLTWTLEARLKGERWTRPWLLIATNDGSGWLYVAALGVLGINVPVGTLQSLEMGSYDLYLSVTNGVFTRQIYLGLLPIAGKHVASLPSYGYGYGRLYG